VVKAVPAVKPTAVLNPAAPAFKVFNAWCPIAVFALSASSVFRASYPTATLPSPVVRAVPASSPTTTLKLPPLAMELPALTPKRTLEVPSVGVDREPSAAIENLFVPVRVVLFAAVKKVYYSRSIMLRCASANVYSIA
jgi:hypothetical protein